MPGSPAHYRGRFAPSPTGPLHLGSLIAALASYLDARHHGGSWLVRMEDLDPPREDPDAAREILASLEQHGLHWDEPVLWQSARHRDYQRALEALADAGELFACDCTRAKLGPGGACDGRCQPRQHAVTPPFASRIAVPPDTTIQFEDEYQGGQAEHLGTTLPDFILRRKDSLYAYQLAVVVDDTFQGITHIVRGSDLLDSTARQVFLQQRLGYITPHYAHLPVITNSDGQKFSKQNHAPALDSALASDNLRQALQFLGQPSPTDALVGTEAILAFAIEHWSPGAVSRTMSLAADSFNWRE